MHEVGRSGENTDLTTEFLAEAAGYQAISATYLRRFFVQSVFYGKIITCHVAYLTIK
jgi:hypothetical protein